MTKQCTIIKIMEDDYGCEELPEGAAVECMVLLQEDGGKTFMEKVSARELDDMGINEGDRVNVKGSMIWPV